MAWGFGTGFFMVQKGSHQKTSMGTFLMPYIGIKGKTFAKM